MNKGIYSPSLNSDPLPWLKFISGAAFDAETAIGLTSSCGGAMSGGATSGSNHRNPPIDQ